MENGDIESFHGKFREECLNEHWVSHPVSVCGVAFELSLTLTSAAQSVKSSAPRLQLPEAQLSGVLQVLCPIRLEQRLFFILKSS
jgi:hypothetical protein